MGKRTTLVAGVEELSVTAPWAKAKADRAASSIDERILNECRFVLLNRSKVGMGEANAECGEGSSERRTRAKDVLKYFVYAEGNQGQQGQLPGYSYISLATNALQWADVCGPVIVAGPTLARLWICKVGGSILDCICSTGYTPEA